MYKIFPLWKTFHLSTTTFTVYPQKIGRYTPLKSLYFQGENVVFEGYIHKSTALIIITIILYISFKINIRFLRERSRGRY